MEAKLQRIPNAEAAYLAATGGQTPGAKPKIVAPAATPAPDQKISVTTLGEGDVELGRASNGTPIGVNLAKLIKGRLLIQGNSGAGKSMLLRRLFEQAFGKVQQLLLDPEGEFSTLAEKFDVAVFTVADLQRLGGMAFALHLREHRYSAVVDLSDATAEDRLTIATDIATGLVDAPEAHWHPILVLVDEAQVFAPHYDTGDVDAETRKRAITSFASLMGRGRKRGLCGIIATQRLAETSKAVAYKTTNIIIGRTTFERDLEGAGKLLGFTAGNSRPLRTLADGEFLAIGPALNVPGRCRFKAGNVQSRHKSDVPTTLAPPSISAAAAAALLQQAAAAKPEPAAAAPDVAPAGRKNGRRGRDWSLREDQIIREGYAAGKKIAEIGAELAAIGYSTSTSNISSRAHSLGLTSAKAAVGWSEREDQIITDAYAREVKLMDIVGLLAAEGFNRGRVAVQMRAINLNITRDRMNYWTEPEKEIAIRGLTDGTPYREIIANLKAAGYERGLTGILKFAQRNNFSRAAEAWTLEEIEQLKQMYADKIPPKDIAEKLGKPIAAIRTRASNLGLKQRVAWSDEEYIALQKFWREGKSLTQAVQSLGRPYSNVARVAIDIGLNFSIDPEERGKAAVAKTEASNG